MQRIRIRNLFLACSLALFSIPAFRAGAQAPPPNVDRFEKFAIATYCSDYDQVRQAVVLIKSLRQFGGMYNDCPVYIALGDTTDFSARSLKLSGVHLLSLPLDKATAGYPLAIKAFAAALIERTVPATVHTLAWFDPETIVLGPLHDLELDQFDMAIRPVFKVNNIGLAAEAEPDAYWSGILSTVGLEIKQMPLVETIIDGKTIRAYYNCEIFSVNPRLGIMQQWAKALTPLLHDDRYQKTACTGFFNKLFLHQAVLSAVAVARVPTDRIRSFPLTCAYPLHPYAKMPREKAISSLNALSCAVLEDLWIRDPNWMTTVQSNEPLSSWLAEAYLDFLKVTDHVYRLEGSCNSYLVCAKNHSLLIDPAGAAVAPQWFKKLLERYPLQAILLTHGHNDHRDNLHIWNQDKKIPVFAQREHVEFVRYHDRLTGLFDRRNAIWKRTPAPVYHDIDSVSVIEPTVLFSDSHSVKVDDLHVKMVHTSGETPDHTLIWIPELKTAFCGDNYYTSFPNLYTLRATKPRWPLDYINGLDRALSLRPEFCLPGHGHPLCGGERVAGKLRHYRNAIQYIHDATVRGINYGKDRFTLMREITLPDSFGIDESYGRASWSVRGIYEGYVGWFDENPTSMYDQSVESIYPELVQLVGVEVIYKRSRELYEQGSLVEVLHLTDIILSTAPDHQQTLQLRLQTLQALRQASRNYIENIWLDYGITTCAEKLTGSKP